MNSGEGRGPKHPMCRELSNPPLLGRTPSLPYQNLEARVGIVPKSP